MEANCRKLSHVSKTQGSKPVATICAFIYRDFLPLIFYLQLIKIKKKQCKTQDNDVLQYQIQTVERYHLDVFAYFGD